MAERIWLKLMTLRWVASVGERWIPGNEEIYT